MTKNTRRACSALRTPELLDLVSGLRGTFPTPPHAVDYIMDPFPIVKRRDEQAHGQYRTKRVILDIYDAMAEAIRTGCPYQTSPGRAGNFIPMDQWPPQLPIPSPPLPGK